MLLEVRIEVHISPDMKIDTVLLLDGLNMGIATLLAQRSFLSSRAVSLHAGHVFCCHNSSFI